MSFMFKHAFVKIFMIAVAFATLPFSALSQESLTFSAAMRQIAANNTALKALDGEFESARLQNSAELCLPDPEVEVGHDWGSPKGVPGRTTVSVSQSLDWGVLTGRRRRLSRANDDMAHATYHVEAQKVMAEADQALVRVIYCNKLSAELSHREQLAAELQQLYENKFSKGDINQLELNKVKLNTAVAHSEWQRAQSELRTALQDVQRLNGGVAITLTDTVYPYAQSALPSLSEMQAAVSDGVSVKAAEVGVKQMQAEAALVKSQGWPTFSVGFQGEYVKENNYNGFSVGLSVPVWGSTRRQLRSAKSKVQTAQLDVDDIRLQQAAQLTQCYHTAVDLSESADRLRQNLESTSNAVLLHKALDAGQISLLDYLLESSFYYTAHTAQLEAERDAQLALSKLRGMLYNDCSGK